MRTVQKNSVLGSQKVGYGAPERAVCIRNISDYSPFGVSLDGRTIQSDFYRYGFQNQEKDDELKGTGNSVNYKYRMHDPRVGRFFAIDPLASKFPWNSVYAFSENKVIAWAELEGKECYFAVDGTYLGQIGTSTAVRVVNENNIEKVTYHINDFKNNCPPRNKNGGAIVYPDETINFFANSANNLSEDVGMKKDELYLRAALDVIQSGEGATKANRYWKMYGGKLMENLDNHPGKVNGHSVMGAYQIHSDSWFGKGNSKLGYKYKLNLPDFSPESQDRAAVAIIINRGAYDNIISGDFDAALPKISGSVWSSLNKEGTADKFKTYIAKELKGETLVATKKGGTLTKNADSDKKTLKKD